MSERKTLISIRGLNKEYRSKGRQKIIFADFNLDVRADDRLGILGKNGVGKTTLANMIIGKTKPDSGKITINESVADKMRCFGYLPQEFSFPEFFTPNDVLKLIETDLKRNGVYDSTLFAFLLEQLEIEQIRHRKYKKLSGGEKQKINLASVLLYKPKILILDEFTSNIDIETSFRIRRMLEAFDCTLIVISHNAKEIAEICNRLIFLKDGKIFRELDGKESITEEQILKSFSDMSEIKEFHNNPS